MRHDVLMSSTYPILWFGDS